MATSGAWRRKQRGLVNFCWWRRLTDKGIGRTAPSGSRASYLLSQYSKLLYLGNITPATLQIAGQTYRLYLEKIITTHKKNLLVVHSKQLKNVKPIENALDKVMELDGIYYRSNELAEQFGYDKKDRHIGVIAQQVKKHFPEIIRQAPFDADGDKGASLTGENYITVQYEKLVAILIEAIKELNDKVNKLNK